MSEPLITKTVELDHCWVCGIKFIECGGTDPAVIRNRHHVVPTANGGKDGPTVTLCSAHHDLLHAIATQVLADKDWEHLLGEMSLQMRAKVIYLSRVVVRSTKAVENDPNKRGQVTVELTGVLRAQLRRLADSDRLSLQGEIIELIQKEYNRRFPVIPHSH